MNILKKKSIISLKLMVKKIILDKERFKAKNKNEIKEKEKEKET